MGLFKSPVRSSDASTLNGKIESQLSVAYANDADKLDGVDGTEFATTGDIPIDYGDVTGPSSATAGNIPLLDETGKILSDSMYTPTDFATTEHIHTGYVASSDYEDSDVLNKIKNVDGYESGLDADLWQGYSPNSITVGTSWNTIQLGGEYPSVYKNTINFAQITNEPPTSYGSGTTVMVGLSASGDFTGYDFGTILRYNGSTWDVIGNA